MNIFSKTLTRICLVVGFVLTASFASSADVMTIINDNVGIGTETPDGALHLLREGGSNVSMIIETQGGGTPAKWELKVNGGSGRLNFKDLVSGNTPFKFDPGAVNNLFRVGAVSSNTVDVGGNLVVNGDVTIAGNCTEQDGACADYVFDEGYQLRSLDSLQQFIKENNHLPNIPSAADMQENGVSLAYMSGRLLEKVEELTLYALQQKKEMDELKKLVREQSAQLAALK